MAMLTLLGSEAQRGNKLARRNFLQIGGLGLGASSVALDDIVRAEPTSPSHKAVIQIYLGGGPPHQDMWDIKTEAPLEVRGEFRPIRTRVPGVHICEVFPRIASILDKCVILRSVVGSAGQHDAYQCVTGWPGEFQPGAAIAQSGRPALGSNVARLQGPTDPSVPPYVLVEGPNKTPPSDGRRNAFRAGHLGAAHDPFEPDEAIGALQASPAHRARLAERRELVSRFDSMRRDLDAGGALARMDSATQSALDLLTSNKVAQALDLSREIAAVRSRYGANQLQPHYGEQTWTTNESFLIARRLVEAGVRCVTLGWAGWDTHRNNFDTLRGFGPELDRAFTALVQDLEDRGLLDDVVVIVWGEFGRTPRINNDAGRDHWPQVSAALLAGGGLRTGQVIGATNRLGEFARERPVHFQEVHATLYHALGISPATTTVRDPSGRPQYLVHQLAIKELI
jgi:hypothetical protein